MTAFAEVLDVDIARDARSGMWSCTCPKCPRQFLTMTERALAQGLSEHMDERHPHVLPGDVGGRWGTA